MIRFKSILAVAVAFSLLCFTGCGGDEPDNPQKPDTPDYPYTPDDPDNPDNPDNPDDPDNPDKDEGIIHRIDIQATAFTASVTGSFTASAYNNFESIELQYGDSYGLSKYKSVTFKSLNFDAQLVNLEARTDYYYRFVGTDKNNRKVSTELKKFTTRRPLAPSYCPYIIDGMNFKMVKVTGLSSGDFYIMQTELPINSVLTVGDYTSKPMNQNTDNVIIKAEFRDFLNALRNATDIEFRIPTAAEWVYAATGAERTKGYDYAGSDNLSEVGWYSENSGNKLHSPASLAPNELGLYDMSGNYGEIINNTSDPFHIDGDVYGGWYRSAASKCKPDSHVEQGSGKIPGTSVWEGAAFDGRYYTVRLVYSAN